MVDDCGVDIGGHSCVGFGSSVGLRLLEMEEDDGRKRGGRPALGLVLVWERCCMNTRYENAEL